LFAPAIKEALKARVALDGPTGSGKTWTALQWARIIVGADGPIGFIDTENRSAAHYAPSPKQLSGIDPINRLNYWDAPYVFGHMPWEPPYDPIKLTAVIKVAGQELGPDGCLIIDSFSHFWEGEGGTLEIVDNAGARAHGNRFAGWKEGTPAQRSMIDAIIHAPCHVICCMRSKMEYILDVVEKNGKMVQVPRKVGMRPIQREGVEYEFTVIGDMDLEHRLVISKSRCDVVADLVLPKGKSADAALTFAEWLGNGVVLPSRDELDELSTMFAAAWPASIERTAIKREFVAKFGAPDRLTADAYEAAKAWVTAQAMSVKPPVTQPADLTTDYSGMGELDALRARNSNGEALTDEEWDRLRELEDANNAEADPMDGYVPGAGGVQ
jgi:hypothetical protein